MFKTYANGYVTSSLLNKKLHEFKLTLKLQVLSHSSKGQLRLSQLHLTMIRLRDSFTQAVTLFHLLCVRSNPKRAADF